MACQPLCDPGRLQTAVRIRKMRLKIVLVGERTVGKTSLVERYVKNHFKEEYTGTLGGRVYSVELEVGLEGEDLALAQVAFFDLMGEHSVRKVFAEPFFFGTHGVLAVCDVGRPPTLYALKDWLRVVTQVAGPVPAGIAFNKVDRADTKAIGPEETAWLRAEFPTVPTFMTSARTGHGVEDAFSTIVSRTVDAALASGRKSRSGRLLRQRMLMLVVDRGGASKNELFADFKGVTPAEILEELDNLVRLGALVLDETGATTFTKAADLPGTVRYRVTDRGKRIAESPKGEELAIEEIV
jgi:small GTP-binding protein